MAWKKVSDFEKLEVIDLTRDGEGTETTGKLVDMREFKSQYNDKMAKVYILECSDGKRRQFYGGSVLDNRLPNVQMGSMIKIVYIGEEPSQKKGQKPFKNYDIFEDDGSGEEETTTPTAAKKKVPF